MTKKTENEQQEEKMKFRWQFVVCIGALLMAWALAPVSSWAECPDISGELCNPITSDLCIRAIIHTEEKGPIEAVWKEGGSDDTKEGHSVTWGHFYADPKDVSWGSEQNPDLFVKIWFDRSGRVDVNFFHVSVPEIEVFSVYDGICSEGITTMGKRYIRQYYENGQGYMSVQPEDGIPAEGYLPKGNPSGYSTIHGLKIGASINTVGNGLIDAVWRRGGGGLTADGHEVLWGHFYADPKDVSWGSEQNPDLFVKIWFDTSGRVDVNFFHVSVPEIEVFSDLPTEGEYDQKGTTMMADRYIRHEYKCEYTATPYTETCYCGGIISSACEYNDDGSISMETLYNADGSERQYRSWTEEGILDIIVVSNEDGQPVKDWMWYDEDICITNQCVTRVIYQYDEYPDIDENNYNQTLCDDEGDFEISVCTQQGEDFSCEEKYEERESECYPDVMTCPPCSIPPPPDNLMIPPPAADKSLWRDWEE